MASLTVACVLYLLSMRELFASPGLPLRLVVIGLTLAAVWHIEFLRLPPGPDDDIHRYVWDGRLQRMGLNPYLVIPNDPALRYLHTPETESLNNPDLPSPYPPAAQLFFRAVTAIHESTFVFKVVFLLCELAIIFLVLDLLRGGRERAHLVLAFAWNPLLAIEVAGSGHIDIVGALLVVISAAALGRRWRATAAVAFGLAVLLKFLPIVLLPLYYKRIRIRDGLLAAVVVGVLYVPFLDHGRIPAGSLATYVQTFRFNGPIFAALASFAPPRFLAALALLVGFVIATRLTTATIEQSPGLFVWPMAATLLFAPVVFPWYLLWLLPFLAWPSTFLIAIWTVSIIPVYIQWHLRATGRPWGALPAWAMWLEYGCLAIAVGMLALRRFKQSSTHEPQTMQ